MIGQIEEQSAIQQEGLVVQKKVGQYLSVREEGGKTQLAHTVSIYAADIQQLLHCGFLSLPHTFILQCLQHLMQMSPKEVMH